MLENSWVAAQLVASQEGLSSMSEWVHKSPPLLPILSQLHLVHFIKPWYYKTDFRDNLPSMLRSPKLPLYCSYVLSDSFDVFASTCGPVDLLAAPLLRSWVGNGAAAGCGLVALMARNGDVMSQFVYWEVIHIEWWRHHLPAASSHFS
jgi:hypothetical protein